MWNRELPQPVKLAVFLELQESKNPAKRTSVRFHRGHGGYTEARRVLCQLCWLQKRKPSVTSSLCLCASVKSRLAPPKDRLSGLTYLLSSVVITNASQTVI
jgi:hypothetical protein